jgi:hypothetical protein
MVLVHSSDFSPSAVSIDGGRYIGAENTEASQSEERKERRIGGENRFSSLLYSL